MPNQDDFISALISLIYEKAEARGYMGYDYDSFEVNYIELYITSAELYATDNDHGRNYIIFKVEKDCVKFWPDDPEMEEILQFDPTDPKFDPDVFANKVIAATFQYDWLHGS